MHTLGDGFKYDVFVSYSHQDKEWVRRELLPVLAAGRLRTCVDADDFDLGALSIVEMERAIVESRKTLAVLTPASTKSEWTTFESALAQTDDPAGARRRVIPLLLRRCDLPRRLKSLVHFDVTTPAQRKQAWPRLVAALAPKPPMSAGRPSTADPLKSPAGKTYARYLVDRYQYLDFRGMGVGRADPPSGRGPVRPASRQGRAAARRYLDHGTARRREARHQRGGARDRRARERAESRRGLAVRHNRRDLDVLQTVRLPAPLALWMYETSPSAGLVPAALDMREHAALLLERGSGEYGCARSIWRSSTSAGSRSLSRSSKRMSRRRIPRSAIPVA